jgi:hypothetical protein
MKAFIFRSAVKSVRYEVFEAIIIMISPIYRQIVFIFYIQGDSQNRGQNVLLVLIFVSVNCVVRCAKAMSL